MERVVGGCRELAAAAPGSTIVVVTHGGVIHAIERHLGVREERLLPNLGGRIVEFGDDGVEVGERFVLVDRPATTARDQI